MVAGARGSAMGTARRGRPGRAVDVNTLRTAANGFLSRVDSLVAEVEGLREALMTAERDNEQLRAELAEGIQLIRGAQAALAHGATPVERQPRRRGRGEQSTGAPGAAPARRRAGRAAAASGSDAAPPAAGTRVRRTPASVTTDLVRAVIGRLGGATASEIAEEISTSGTEVSGRAIRHIAGAAGAVARAGADGRMVYTLG
jgi:hypothetical protein